MPFRKRTTPSAPTPLPVDHLLRRQLSPSPLYHITDRPGPDMRVCLATLLQTPQCSGDYPGRSAAAVALTAELLRLGRDRDEVEAILEEWNRSNTPPLRTEELLRAVENGFSDRYDYSCEHPILAGFCVGSECPYFNTRKPAPAKVRNFRFIDFAWPQILSNRQVLLYYVAIPYLESKRRVGPGGLLFVNHRQLAEIAGISTRLLGKDLQRLSDVGLIHYKPGIPRKWLKLASEVSRIIPIPPPRLRFHSRRGHQ